MIGCDPLHEMPILDLRLRKAVRRDGLRLWIASDRPTTLDGGAEETARYAPGDGAALPHRLRRSRRRRGRRRRAYREEIEKITDLGRERNVVVIYGERLLPRRLCATAAAALLKLREASSSPTARAPA